MGVRKGYKSTEAGEIPEDWDIRPLSAVANMRSGFGITQRHISHCAEYPCYGGNGLRGFTEKYTHDGQFALIGRQGALCGNVIGVSGKLFASEHAIVVDSLPGINIVWLTHLLSSMNLNKYSESSAQPGLSVKKIKLLTIPVPSTLAEQSAIAAALSDTDSFIDSMEALIEKKRLIKRGTMEELLTGERRLAGFNDEWDNRKLGEVGVFYKGRGISKDQAKSGSIPCVRYGEIYTKHNDVIRAFYSRISEETASSATRLVRGDVLFAASGETKEDIGKSVAFLNDIEAYCGGDIIILRSENSDSAFLGYYLNTDRIRKQKSAYAQGDAIVHIHARDLAEIAGLFPPKPEQSAIAQVLSDMDAEIEALEAKLEKARAIKRGMMEELLTGRIRLV